VGEKPSGDALAWRGAGRGGHGEPRTVHPLQELELSRAIGFGPSANKAPSPLGMRLRIERVVEESQLDRSYCRLVLMPLGACPTKKGLSSGTGALKAPLRARRFASSSGDASLCCCQQDPATLPDTPGERLEERCSPGSVHSLASHAHVPLHEPPSFHVCCRTLLVFSAHQNDPTWLAYLDKGLVSCL
jgi:hypothetical protein